MTAVASRFGKTRCSLSTRADDHVPGLVSVIVPCFNAEAFVGDAIDSALAQTHPDVEVIVIDDGSTDRSLEVIRGYGSRVAYRTGPNAGACSARNDGLECARGEFVQFLDADDVLLPDAIARRLAAVRVSRADSVFGERVPLDAEGEPMRSYVSPHPARGWERIGWAPYIIATNIHTLEPLHTRAWACRVGGFDESFPQSQEPDFHLRLVLAGCRFEYLPGPVGGFRQHAGTQRISAAAWWLTDPERHIEIARHWIDLASKSSPEGLDPELRRAAARLLCNRAIQASGAGATHVARRYRDELLHVFPGYRPAGATGVAARLLGLMTAIRLAGLARRARSRRSAG